MKEVARDSPTSAHSWFMEKILPLLEELVPIKNPKKKIKNKVDRKRKLTWRKISKLQNKIHSASSASKLAKEEIAS